MSSILTAEEILFLEKINKQKQKHLEAQAKYRASKKEEIKIYNKKYHEQKQAQLKEINKKLSKEPKPEPTPINIQELTQPPIVDKRTRRGRKKATTTDIKPSYETRAEPLEYSTMTGYVDKANTIHKIFKNKPLPQEVKAELRKLLNDNANINEPLILAEMNYLNNDIEPTIQTLRTIYTNDNSFKSYINVLAVITSHFKTLNKSVYQTLTKTNIFVNKQVQEKRELNEVAPGDEGKIIDLDKSLILSNIDKLDNIGDKLIFALYTLMPSRREEWRSVKITTEANTNKLNDINYLILSTNPKQVVFNDYKTSRKYGKQVFNIPEDLNQVINKYISMKGLKPNDYLFGLDRDRKEYISQPNFSKKISDVFKKVYKIPISLRFLRQSWSVWINTQKISIKAKKEYINMMAHSQAESDKYFKLL
jgi:hypothetical protein